MRRVEQIGSRLPTPIRRYGVSLRERLGSSRFGRNGETPSNLQNGRIIELLDRPRSLEQERNSITITPESLARDNHSEMAFAGIRRWQGYRNSENQKAVIACADPRGVMDELSYSVRLVSAGVDPEKYQGLFTDKSTRGIIAVTHFNGRDFKPGHHPTGCGGQGAKEQGTRDSFQPTYELARPINTTADFVDQRIGHYDAVMQARFVATRSAELTRKPTLAAIQDHTTGLILPLAVYRGNGLPEESSIPQSAVEAQQHNPAVLYKNGIPTLRDDQLGIFSDFITRNRAKVEILDRRYPDYGDVMKENRPKVMVLSTDVRPLAIRFPDTLGVPGISFEVRLRQFIEHGVKKIAEEDIHVAGSQLDYAASHSNKSLGTSQEAFGQLTKLFIETENFELSKKVVETLLERPDMKEWAEREGNQIIVAEANDGKIVKIDWFRHDKNAA